MSVILKNNVEGFLATTISASDVSLVLQPGDGAAFPNPVSPDYFYATLVSTGGTVEVVRVTARAGDTLSILRGQDGTTANSFAAGSRLEMRVNAQSVIDTVYSITNYQGGSASNPTTRLDGSALQAGDFYFNTSADEVRFYNGTAWQSLTTGSIDVQNFVGNGVQTTFTLSQGPTGENNTQVYIKGVYQQKDTYSISGLSLIFSTAPPAGTTIEVVTIEAIAIGQTSSDLVSYQPAGVAAVPTTVRDKLRETVSVKDFGAVGDGVADDTAAIQAAIETVGDGGELWFPKGNYSVSQIYFNRTYQTIWFDGAQLIARSNDPTEAVVHIVRRQCTFYNMFISGAFKTNYASAIKWYAESGSMYPGYVKLFNLQINDAVVGILYGAFTSPVDAPVSENNVVGYTTRGVIKPLYTNQPNGFLFMSNCVFDCQKYEWDIAVPGYFDYATAVCVQNHQCVLSISNSAFVKAASDLGYGIINRAVLSLSNVTAEIASPNFFIGNPVVGSTLPYSETHINGYYNYFWNNSTQSFFECENGSNRIIADDVRYVKGSGASSAANGLIDTNVATGIVARFSNCLLRNQIMSAVLAPDTRGYYTQSDVRITSSYVEDTANSYSISLSMSDDNAASNYQFQDITKYDVVQGGPNATAAIVASGSTDFAQAIELTSTDATSLTVATKKDTDGSIRINKRAPVVEFSMKVLAGTVRFYGSVTALFYDDAGTFISTQDLGSNGVIGPFTSIAGAQEYVTVRRTLTPPTNAAQVSLRFGISDYAQTWRVGNIKVY